MADELKIATHPLDDHGISVVIEPAQSGVGKFSRIH